MEDFERKVKVAAARAGIDAEIERRKLEDRMAGSRQLAETAGLYSHDGGSEGQISKADLSSWSLTSTLPEPAGLRDLGTVELAGTIEGELTTEAKARFGAVEGFDRGCVISSAEAASAIIDLGAEYGAIFVGQLVAELVSRDRQRFAPAIRAALQIPAGGPKSE